MTPLLARSRGVLAALVAAALLLPGSIAMAQEPTLVLITDTLTPASLEVDLGTSVTWRNEDDERHRVRSREGPAEFDSGNLEPGESFTFTFSLAGSYPYRDERDDDDPAYAGTIVVRAGSGDAPGASGPVLATSGTVSLIDDSFVPPTLEIATGGTVTWSNDDGDDRHTVTSDAGAFDSGILEGGATFSQTFTEPGTYPYACLIHPEMRGTINVSGAANEGPSVLPSASAVPPSASADPSAAAASADPLAPSAPSVPASGSTGAAVQVSMAGLEFAPAVIEVKVGESVDWINDDSVGHTVTALDGSFNSGVMGVGDSFTQTFETPGTFDYLCAIHPTMKGTVTVTE
jgi:plastocyanin